MMQEYLVEARQMQVFVLGGFVVPASGTAAGSRGPPGRP
jgi:hypothetical protein